MNYLPIILSLFVGLISISSHLMFRGWMGGEYRGIGMILSPNSLDGAWYHAVIQEAIEGGKPWNAILFEQKDAQYPIPDLAERIMALPGRVLPWSADTVLLLWRFILPVLLTLVIYQTGYFFVHSKKFALLAAFSSVLLGYFIYVPAPSLQILFRDAKPLTFTLYDRPVHPQFEAPLVWLLLFVIARSPSASGRRGNLLIAGLILGLLTHTYFWAWTWGYAAMLSLLLIAVIQRSKQAIYSVLLAWLIALIIGLPIIAALAQAFFDGGYPERLAAYQGNVLASIWLNLPVLVAAALFLRQRQKADLGLRVFISVGLLATFIALNQQVVTGISLQPDHYISLFGGSFSVWVIMWSLWTHVSPAQLMIKHLIVAVTMGLSFVGMLGLQYRIFLAHREHAKALQPFNEVANWLNLHADKQDVVFANQEIGLLVPIYTHQNLWWHFYALSTPVSQERIEHSAFTWFGLLGIAPKDLPDLAKRQPVDFTQYFTLTTLYEERLRLIDKNLTRWQAAYETFLKQQTLPEALKQYRIDYVLFDKQLDTWDPRKLEVKEELLENKRFILYSVEKVIPAEAGIHGLDSGSSPE